MDSKEKKRLIDELNKESEGRVMKRPWTEDEVEIVKMFYGRVPVNVIAKKLNRSHNAVGDLIVRRGLKAQYDRG